MKYPIVQLTNKDTVSFRELLEVFGDAFKEKDTYGGDAPSEDYLAKLLQKDTFIALVAKDADKVVGGLTAYVLEKFEKERKEVYIYDLAVLEPYRKQGIARGLINRLKEVAKE